MSLLSFSALCKTCLQDVIAQFRATVKLAFRTKLLSFGAPCKTILQDVIAQFRGAVVVVVVIVVRRHRQRRRRRRRRCRHRRRRRHCSVLGHCKTCLQDVIAQFWRAM